MATGKFTGFGWLLGIATVSPACYMVSSQVAAERGRVEAVERAIHEARRDIRGLETEFDTRANLAQLERWNGDVLALSAPRPEQYLSSDATLTALRPFAGGQQFASLVVPAATDPIAPPVEAVAATASAAPAVVTAALASPPAVETARATVHQAVARRVVAGQVQAVAMIEGKLLSESTFGDLVSGARAEKVALR